MKMFTVEYYTIESHKRVAFIAANTEKEALEKAEKGDIEELLDDECLNVMERRYAGILGEGEI